MSKIHLMICWVTSIGSWMFELARYHQKVRPPHTIHHSYMWSHTLNSSKPFVCVPGSHILVSMASYWLLCSELCSEVELVAELRTQNAEPSARNSNNKLRNEGW